MTIGTIIAQHVGLVRNGPAPTPPAPAPAPVVVAPLNGPLDLRVQAVPSLGATVGVPLSSVTVATLQGADPAPTILVDQGIAGLTFSLSWAAGVGTVTVSGTPTAGQGVYRAVLYYLNAAGEVRGGSIHEVVVVNAAATFQVLTQLSASGQIGQAMNSTLATLRHTASIEVQAALNRVLPAGVSVSLSWVPGSPSNGTLTITGNPAEAGTFDLTVTYRWRDVVLGTTTHQIAIGLAAPPPAPPPPPAPAPAPQPPAPAPAPIAPAPAPRPAGDPLLSSVLLSERFELTAQDIIDLGVNEGGSPITSAGPVYVDLRPTGLLAAAGTIVNNKDISPAPPASGNGGGRFANSTWYIRAPGSSLLALSAMTAECYVKPVSAELWTTYSKNTAGYLFAMMSGRAAGGGSACCWSIGFISAQVVGGVAGPRRLFPYLHIAFADGQSPISLVGSAIPALSGHVHLAGQVERSGSDAVVSLWCGGRRVAMATRAGAPALRQAESVWLGRVGVTDNDAMRSSFSGFGTLSRNVSFGTFDMDDARLTGGARYTAALGVSGADIPPDMLTIPWPTY